MQRSPHVIRAVLLAVERYAPLASQRLTVPGVELARANYHLSLLMKAGYVDARDESTLRSFSAQIMGLSWMGHEFVEAVRDDAVWQAIADDLKLGEQSVPFSVIEEVAIRRQRESAGLNPEQKPTATYSETAEEDGMTR